MLKAWPTSIGEQGGGRPPTYHPTMPKNRVRYSLSDAGCNYYIGVYIVVLRNMEQRL